MKATIELKKEIIAKFENGVRVSDLATQYGMAKSTISTFTSAEGESMFTFKASRGWFEKFKHRTGIHSVTRHGEAASSNKEAAEKYVAEFSDYVNVEGFLPQQVFNCDETGLFWKKRIRLNITFIMLFFFVFTFLCVICCLNTRLSILYITAGI